MSEEKMTRGGMLSPTELSTFSAQVGMILRSGIPLTEGMGILYEDTPDGEGKKILGVVRDHVELGEPLYIAAQAAGCFPDYAVYMMEVGEKAGRLDQVMDSLYEYYEREQAISKNIRSAVSYPLIMIVMMLVVIGVLVVKVMPIFDQVYRQLGSEMTGFSQSVMNIGNVLSSSSIVLAILFGALVLAYVLSRTSRGFRAFLGNLGASFFLTKGLYGQIASGKFASAMSLMLASGLDVDQSLEMSGRLVDNRYLREKIALCQDYIKEGTNFSEALVQSGIFTGIYARMVAVGAKTGATDTIMSKLADRYEEETNTKINSIIAILEPTLVAVLSVIVGMILLSVMLPLVGIMSSIG